MSNLEENSSTKPRPGQVATVPAATDPRLRGRAYSVRFDSVWSAAREVGRTLRGWEVTAADARGGEIRAEVTGWPWKRPDDAVIRVWLDEVGLTRVDLTLTPQTPRLGTRVSARRIGRFLRALDAAVQLTG